MDLQKSLALAREDPAAFRAVYDLTIGHLYGFTVSRVRDKDIALDICQEVYLALWRGLPKFQYMSDAQVYGYLFRVAKRQMNRQVGTKLTHVPLEDVLEFIGETAKPADDYRRLLAGIQGLREKERMCVELRYFQDMKFEEIAQALGVTENYAKVIHHRAINALKRNSQQYV